MRFGSLFSGVGGLDEGLKCAGMECTWHVEIDAWCRRVLTKHWPDTPRYDDIRDVESLPYVDLISGGFPCPPVSLAAAHLRKFEDDERWLWDEFFRIICEVRPEWVLVENVPGLLSARDGQLFGGILRDLASIGLDAEWDMLSAEEFGAPQLRKRVFIVAYAKSVGLVSGCEIKAKIFESRLRQEKYRAWWTKDITGISGRIFKIPNGEIFRTTNGVYGEVDRLRGLGNAVVPIVAQYIGERILEHAKETWIK